MRIALPQSRRALLLVVVLAALVLLLGFVALRPCEDFALQDANPLRLGAHVLHCNAP